MSLKERQLGLAWLLHKAPHVLPIPGTTSADHLQGNFGGGDVRLSQDVMTTLEALIDQGPVSGPRYPSATQAEIDTEEF